MKYLIAFLSLSLCSLLADTVTLKNGNVESDVKSYVRQTIIEIQYKNGTFRKFTKAEVKHIKFIKVEWKIANSNESEENEWKRIAEEQKRYNELLKAEIDELKSQNLPKYTSNNILISSALIPGFGQYKNGKILKGALFSGSFFLSLIFTGFEYQKFNSIKDSINRLNSIAPATFLYPEQLFIFQANNVLTNERNLQELSITKHRINIGIGVSLFLYLYNLVDAKFFSGAYKENFDKPKVTFIMKTQLDRIAHLENYHGLELQWSF